MSRLVLVEVANKSVLISTGRKRFTLLFAHKVAVQICKILKDKSVWGIENELYKKFQSKDYIEVSGYWNEGDTVMMRESNGNRGGVKKQDLIVILMAE